MVSITARVCESKVVLVVDALRDQRLNVVDIELAAMQDQVDGVVTDKTLTGLPLQQTLLQSFPF